MTQVDYVGDAGSIQINCKQYSLQQCHWHSPAEHLINGKRSLSLSLKLNVSPPTNFIYNDFLTRYDLELRTYGSRKHIKSSFCCTCPVLSNWWAWFILVKGKELGTRLIPYEFFTHYNFLVYMFFKLFLFFFFFSSQRS